jgi:hypothetical protein
MSLEYNQISKADMKTYQLVELTRDEVLARLEAAQKTVKEVQEMEKHLSHLDEFSAYSLKQAENTVKKYSKVLENDRRSYVFYKNRLVDVELNLDEDSGKLGVELL